MIKSELFDLAWKAAGSKGTVDAVQSTARDFILYLKMSNNQIRHAKNIKVRDLEGYGQYLLDKVDDGLILVRTAQNKMAHMRKMLRKLGKFGVVNHERTQNEAIGLTGGDRSGKHRALTDEEFQSYYHEVKKRNEDSAFVMLMQRGFGLRAQEAIRACNKMVLTRILRDINLGNKVLIVEGTKGGRPRRVSNHNSNILKEIIQLGLSILKRSGRKYVLNGAGGNLKSALDRYLRDLSSAGMKGEISSHSLRYSWAQESMRLHIQYSGVSYREALILVSLDLGHGDGRGRFILQIYGREGIGYRLSLASAVFGLLDDEFWSS